jgi:hypothetical protein
MCEDGGGVLVRSVSRWEVGKQKKTHLEERPDQASTALIISASSRSASCARAPSAALASARLFVLSQRPARIHECGGKGRLAVQWLVVARARYRTARGAGQEARCEPDAGAAECIFLEDDSALRTALQVVLTRGRG